jgi:hypothetical protein
MKILPSAPVGAGDFARARDLGVEIVERANRARPGPFENRLRRILMTKFAHGGSAL